MHISSQWGRYPAASSLSQAAQPKGSAQNVQQLLPLYQAWQPCTAGPDMQRLVSDFQGAPEGGAARLVLEEAAVWACTTQL